MKSILATFLVGLLFVSCSAQQHDEQKEIPVSKSDTIYDKVDQMPEFNGGKNEFFSYIQNNLKYPDQAKKAGVEGKVFVEFIISKTGTIESAKILRGIGAGCDEAALQVIQNSPDWNPGIKDGKIVNVKLVLPITFSLS